MKRSSALHCTNVLIVVGVVAVWASTGYEGYTRWPNEKLSQSDVPSSEAEDKLFADIGFETIDDSAKLMGIESRFALGLVPGGLDLQHLLSVASIGALAISISITSVLWQTIRRRGRNIPSYSTTFNGDTLL